ncbi:MAG: GxxExxY protein [Treponematales bacterium]
MELLYKEEVYKIIGAAIEVHKELGAGFLEPVYQEALEYEFNLSEIPYRREAKLPICYKAKLLEKCYFADFICFDKIIVELKALSRLTTEHYAQVLNYLKAANIELGVILNFGSSSLEYKRIIRDNSRNSWTVGEAK